MSMTVQQARVRVFNYLDDDGTATTDGSRWTTDEVDQKLKVALEAVCTQYAASGGSRLNELVSVSTNSDGYADLGSYRPLQISTVRLYSGGTYENLQPITARDFQSDVSAVVTLSVLLVRSPTWPSSSTDTITYGPGLSFETMDELICIKAARMLLTKDRELDQSLELQFSEILRTMLLSENVVQVFDFPSGRNTERPHIYAYFYVPYGLYLGRKVF
jgi:hypothetical protein